MILTTYENRKMRTQLKQPYKQFFGTVANQVRLDIIEVLNKENSNVSNIVKKVPYEQSTISHSLKRLEECGFVSVEKQGKERIYSLNRKTITPLLNIMKIHMDKYCCKVVAKKEGKLCH